MAEETKKHTNPWWMNVLNTGIIATVISLTGIIINYSIQNKEIKFNQEEKQFNRDLAKMKFNYELLKDYLALVNEGDKKEKLMFDYMIMAFSDKLDKFATTLSDMESKLIETDLKLKKAQQSLENAKVDNEKEKYEKEIAALEEKIDKLNNAVTTVRNVPFAAGVDFGNAISSVSSVRDELIREHPELTDKITALSGLMVRHGDVIDAITPIFSTITPELEIEKKIVGKRFGGSGGGETTLEKKGYIITDIIVERGEYFGRSEVIHIQVVWHKLTKHGIDASSKIVSKKLGSGNYAKNMESPKEFRARTGYYISDFRILTSDHTSGGTFLHDIFIKDEKLPIGTGNASETENASG